MNILQDLFQRLIQHTSKLRLILNLTLVLHVLGFATETLSLKQSVALALQNHPQILSAEGSESIARSNLKSNQAPFWPQIGVQANASRHGNEIGNSGTFTKTSSLSTELGAQQNLWDFGKTSAKITGSEKSWEASKAETKASKQAVALGAETAYFTLLQAQAVLLVNRDALNHAQAHLDQVKGFLETGKGTRYNVIQAEVEVANAQLNLIRAENEMHNSHVKLENAIGVTLAFPVTLSESLTVLPMLSPDLPEMQQALDNHPELVAAKLHKEAGEASIKAAERNRWPELTGLASYGWSGSDFNTAWSRNWNLGLGLSLPIFSGGAQQASIAASKGNLQILMASEKSLKQNISLEVQQQTYAQHEALQRLQSAEKLSAQAQLALDLAQERYRLGSGNALELKDAELSLANARIARIQAICDAHIAQAHLQKAMGTLQLPSLAEGEKVQ